MTRQEIIKQYNSFPKEKRNMPIAAFIRQVESLQDPVKAQQDAMQIIQGRQQKRIIDGVMRGQND